MQLIAGSAVSVLDKQRRVPLREFETQQVHAVAGIGNPGRFFRMLEAAGLQPITHAFADHHDFVQSDLQFNDDLSVLMTEKDAVKCAGFARLRDWYVPVKAQLPDVFFERVQRLLTIATDEVAA